MSPSLEERVEAAAAEYLQAADHGQAPPREEFLARYPELAGELGEFLDDLLQFGVLGTPRLPEDADPATTQTFSGAATIGATPSPIQIPDYEILAELGRGGMGVVYRARQISINRTVALKTISPDRLETLTDRDRFLREAEAAAGLDHPHIVPIYEVGETQGRPYFTMKLVEGGSLAERKDAYLKDPSRAAELIAVVARAVHFAHQRGILHRDLKPSNILLADASVPLVADLGLAKRLDGTSDASKSGAIVGTPSYMSAEQARGEKGLSTATDVYGLGAILYELLTGNPPFRAPSAAETLVLVLSSEVARPRLQNASVPADLELICLKCLAKQPNERYSSAEGLAEELERWLRGDAISIRTTGRVERASKWVRRNPSLTAVYALLAVSVLFGMVGGGSYWMWRSSEASRVLLATSLEGEQMAREEAEAAKLRELSGRDAFEQLAYLHQIHLAYQEWKENPTPYRAEALLNECPEARRGWEWWFVKRLCHGGAVQTLVHPSGVQSVAFSPGGRFLATLNGTEVRVWNVQTGQSLFTSKGQMCVRFSADGQRILTGGSGNRITFLDARTGVDVKSVEIVDTRLQSFAVSPDGMHIAFPGRDSRVQIVDLNTGLTTASMAGHKSGVTEVTYSRDGKFLASTSMDGTAKIWDVESGKEKQAIIGHIFRSYGVAFSPDSLQIATAGWDQTVKVWNAENGREVRVLKGEGRGLGFVKVAYSPDGRWLAATNMEGLVKLWEAKTGVEAGSFKGHTESAWGLAFSPDSELIASGCGDLTARVWSVAASQTAMVRGGNSQISSLSFTPDSRSIATAGGFNTGEQGQVILRDSQSGVVRLRLSGATLPIRALTFSSDGTQLVAAGRYGAITIWNALDGTVLKTLPSHTINDFQSVALSPDGNFLALGAPDRAIQLWDLRSGALAREMRGHIKVITQLAFSADGRRLASAAFENAGPNPPTEVKVWDVRTGNEVATLNPSMRITSVALNAVGNLVAVGNGDYSVAVWELSTGKEVSTLKGHTRSIGSLCFSPDSTRLVSTDTDWSVSIWDLSVGRETIRLKAGTYRPFNDTFSVHVASFSPDGQKIAWGGLRRCAQNLEWITHEIFRTISFKRPTWPLMVSISLTGQNHSHGERS